jgi:hypothetical protein
MNTLPAPSTATAFGECKLVEVPGTFIGIPPPAKVWME